jgi:hypothetical protein
MPVKVICPKCETSLNAPEDLLGQTVKCEECGSTFTARAPARSRAESDEPSRSKYPSRRDDDEDEDDDDDRRPRRRSVRKKGSSPVPYILAGGGLVFFVLLIVGLGLYFMLRVTKSEAANAPVAAQPANRPNGFAPLPQQPNNPPQQQPNNPPPQNPPANNQPGAGAQKVTLSNPRWSGGFADFEVDWQLANGQQLIGINSLKWKYADGTMGSANLHITPFSGQNGTVKIHVIGPGMIGRRGGGRQAMEIWVEEGGVGLIAGTKVSNTVTLN